MEMSKVKTAEKDFQQVTDEYAKQRIESMREELADEEQRERISSEGALTVEVRADWHIPEDRESGNPNEYKILLGWGGPASQIIGDLSECGEPENARFQYQDWFKPWTDARLSDEDTKTLLEYARQFYFGE
jgi:hypothetical protein